jgi:Putative amidase domain
MQFFLRDRARQYALEWATRRNPKFPDYSQKGFGGDCTNFVSQCLMAAGWTATLGDSWAMNAWWSAPDESSNSWAAADWFRRYVKLTERASLCGVNELAWGDLVFVVPNRGDRAHHVMIVCDVKYKRLQHPTDSHEVFLCGHNYDRINHPLWKVWESVGGERNVEYWKVADMVPRRKLSGPAMSSARLDVVLNV